MAASDQRDEVIIKLKARIRELEELWENAVKARDELYTRNTGLREALGAAYLATEPIAVADEHDVVTEDGYTSINENTRKAIVKARRTIEAALKGV